MLEGYITPLLTSYLDKYVRNLKPSDLQLSFWGGDAVLRNLELRVDVLEREIHIPLEFTSGRIRELTLHIPWNAIVSSPVQVTIKDLELVVKLKNTRVSTFAAKPSESTDSLSSQVDPPSVPPLPPGEKEKPGEQAPGYLHSYLTRISNNIQVCVQNLVVKVMEEEHDLMLTLNIGEVEYFTADDNWEKKFVYTDCLHGNYSVHKVCKVSDMMVNLHTIEVGGQETTSREPFLQRCCLTFRSRSEFRGNIFVKKSNHILFESLVFSVDEKQFCLFLHLVDWMVAVYYSSKKLKGRDDLHLPADWTPRSTKATPTSSPTTPESVSVDKMDQPDPVRVETDVVPSSSGQGWGTWVWSFIADTDEMAEPRSSQEIHATPGSKNSTIEPNSTFAVFAKSVCVTMKVTHQVQVPLFYSFRHFTVPVLHVSFTGCMAQVDKVPLTKLFLFSMGIASVSASISGLCPCIKRFPSSWRRSSVAASSPETREREIQVFSMGTDGKTEGYHDDSQVIEVMLKRSLFAPPIDTPTTPDSATIELPPLADPDLAQLGQHYKALWFTYQYFDVGPSRTVEECTETLHVGHMTATFSPDVLHRLQHFIQALRKSSASAPRFSEGMVVLGDPKAETIFNIELAGGQAVLTANGHYLPTANATSPHLGGGTKKSSKKAKKPKSVALPSLCLVVCGATLNLVLPMYSGNATSDAPQRTQLKARLCDIHSGTLTLQRLEAAQTRVAIANGESSVGVGEFKQCLHIPAVELSYHTKSYGERQEGVERDGLYLQFDVEKIVGSFSHTHASKLLFLAGTWATTESHSSSCDIECPAHPGSKLGYLHMSILKTSLTYSGMEHYSLSSAVVGELSVAMVKDSSPRKLGCLLPVVYGPLDTSLWSTVNHYNSPSYPFIPPPSPSERVVELLMARPYQNMTDVMFPTFQLSVSGFAACFDPALLQFVKELPLGAYAAGTNVSHTNETTQIPELPSFQTTPTITTPSVIDDEAKESEKVNILSLVKGYATKVTIMPIIIVFPDRDYTPLLTGSETFSIANNLPEFPILPLLSSPSPLSPSAVVLSLPGVLLQSARSHVLDEPVPKESQVDTLPWDCSFTHASLFTVIRQKARYLVEPVVVKATLAPQQEGCGVTVHVDTLALVISRKQVELVNSVSHDVVAMVTRPTATSSSLSMGTETDDSGIIVSSRQEPSPPSVISSQAHSTITPPTLPAGSEVSTMSSSLVFQGFSTLWLQLLVSKLSLTLYHRQPPFQPGHTAPSEYATPFTSPTSTGATHKLNEGDCSTNGAVETVSLSLEADGISFQLDIQERCTDVIFKMASAECSYLKRPSQDTTIATSWCPYFSGSHGKLFSTTSSSLPEELSHITDPLSHSLAPVDQVASSTSPAGLGYHLSPQQHSPKLQPNFVQLKAKVPHSPLPKAIKLSLSVKPFEVVAWLPLLDTVREVLSAGPASSQGPDRKFSRPASSEGGVAAWPSVEVSIECFRVVLPTIDHSHFLLLGVGGVTMTSSLEYVGPDVRYITNSSAFRRLSSERRQAPLPAYQLQAISMSLWGVDNSTRSLSAVLFGSCSDVRVVYTPPLYWTPHSGGPAPSLTPPTILGPSKLKLSVLATGHCVEVNLASDVAVFCGSQQVDCLSKVLSENHIPSGTTHGDTSTAVSCSGADSSARKETPFKCILIGRSISLALLTTTPTDDATPPVSPRMATPFMLAALYNPLCVMEVSTSSTMMEASCFNMAISYSLEQTSLSYFELAADPLSIASFMKWQLLETRKGKSHDKSGLPPSLLSLSWARQSHDLESGSKGGVVSLEVGRPLKLTVSISLLREALRTLDELKKSVGETVMSPKRSANDSLLVGGVEASDSRSQSEFATPKSSEDISFTAAEAEASGSKLTELYVTTDQVVVELVLTLASASDDDESERAFSPCQEADVSLQGEALSLSSSPVSKEGLVLTWQSFTLAIPPADLLTHTSELSVDSLQLLSISDGLSSDILSPTHLSCLVTRHKPCSSHDLPRTGLKFLCSLFQVRLSRVSLELLRRAVDEAVGLMHKSSNEDIAAESCDAETVASHEGGVVHFTDDLRTEDFKYIMNESTTAPPVPQPGNIVFHHGNGMVPPTMTWQYSEPRAITKLHTLPVPFTITTEEDAPVDIKLSCSLEYWSDAACCYKELTHFHISESVPAEWEVPASVPLGSIASRMWRICVNHIEWIDDDMEEILVESVTSVSGTSIPLSSVLSPISLAACTRVDSIFSPHFIPLFSVTVNCNRLELTLLHQPGTPADGSAVFEGYQIVSPQNSLAAHELLRLTADSGRLFLKQVRDPGTLLKVEASLKADYVDEGCLVWRTALYPTQVDLLLEHSLGREGKLLTSAKGSSLSASLQCGPAVIRLSQGLVHTTSMATQLWKETSDSSPSLFLTSHYIICNDIIDDIHFGQVATGEDVLLPSDSCLGYSWRNHRARQQLHACLVSDGSWRWTKPFSIEKVGVQTVDMPIGRHMATLVVKVALIGGLQKQVTFLGSWKFFSFIHYPLELQLTMASDTPDTPLTHTQESASKLKVLTLQPEGSLPSIVAADSLLGGVKFRIAGGDCPWSKIYPLGNSVQQWSKPHLLAELPSNEEGPIHFWYTTAPLETAATKTYGHKISFSPLFVVTNHLPYELAVTITDSQTLPSLPSSPSSPRSFKMEWRLPGGGATKPLYSLSADSWYHLQFRTSISVGFSEPSLALSTFLLHHLPISKEDQGQQQTSATPRTTKPAIAYLSLPLTDGSCFTAHAMLVRSSVNTIAAVLLTEVMIVNECPWEVEVAQLVAGDDEKDEALWEGKVLVADTREKRTILEPSERAVCISKQFRLCVSWRDTRLVSAPLSFPNVPPSQKKAEADGTTSVVQMVSGCEEGMEQVVAEVSLTFIKSDTSITAAVRPSYIVHNSSDHTIHAWPCLVNRYTSPPADVEPNLTIVKEVLPSAAQPVLFWQKLSQDSPGKSLSRVFRMTSTSPLTAPSSWSILLSPQFVRHSFSLPLDDPTHCPTPALLTMHELNGTTYLVVSHDPSPRLLVQNLCPAALEVVETGAKGIHASSQAVLPGHEVTFDPPSLAKLYPLVYDSDIASEDEKRLHVNAQKVSLSFRVTPSPPQARQVGWSRGYPLANEQDVVLNIPGFGDVLISIDRCGNSQFISILPTCETPALQATSTFAASLASPPQRELRLSCALARVVLCVDDDRASQVTPILQLVADEVDMFYWRSNSKGTKIELTLNALQVDNMTVQSAADFSVLLLPRSHHAARPQLIKSTPPPLLKALVQYNPRLENVVDLVHVMVQPLTVQLEDSLLHRLQGMLPSFTLPGVLRTTSSVIKEDSSPPLSSSGCAVPAAVLKEADIDACPLIISRVVIGPTAVYLTASITLKAFLSCRDSPFSFTEYELTNISSNLSEVSQVVAARYISAVFMHLGWLLGSLELIGSPGTLIQSLGRGLRDLVSLPYEGLTRSPGLFIIGIGHGAVSFVRQCSTGALTSITNFASSIARNMERLSMDSEHSSYQEQKRKEKPTTHFTSGVSAGVSSFGLSLISAVAGLVDQPMQSFQRVDESSSTFTATRSVLAGVGKGLIGVVTKPVGGAMELVAHTGQGIMHGTGLMQKLVHRSVGSELETFTQPLDKSDFDLTVASCQRKLESGPCLAVVPGARVMSTDAQPQLVLLLLTADKVYLLDVGSSSLQQHFNIEQCKLEKKDSSQIGMTELHLIPHSRSDNEEIALPPSNYQAVEHYLKLSQMEAQEIPAAAMASGSDGGDDCDNSSNIVLHVGEEEATLLLSAFHSIRGHILEPDLSFCVYASLLAATKEESFFSVFSHPTS